MDNLKTIAIILARGGSKGLPRKNVRKLAGKPLIVHSIDHAKESGVCDEVLVTTDDDEIAEISMKAGAVVPFRRPPELATDSATPDPVITHALTTYEDMIGAKFDIVVYLQPTDVFRTPEMIAACVNHLKKNPAVHTAFSGYKTHKHFWKKTNEGYVRLTEAVYSSRQERGDKVTYREDQGVASATRAWLVREGKRLGSVVEIMPTEDFRTTIDIHDEFDFWLAEKVLTEWNHRNPR